MTSSRIATVAVRDENFPKVAESEEQEFMTGLIGFSVADCLQSTIRYFCIKNNRHSKQQHTRAAQRQAGMSEGEVIALGVAIFQVAMTRKGGFKPPGSLARQDAAPPRHGASKSATPSHNTSLFLLRFSNNCVSR
jgi:hypothetical protein